MIKTTWGLFGIIVGLFWGTVYGLYDGNWIPSLMYMIICVIAIMFFERGAKE